MTRKAAMVRDGDLTDEGVDTVRDLAKAGYTTEEICAFVRGAPRQRVIAHVAVAHRAARPRRRRPRR